MKDFGIYEFDTKDIDFSIGMEEMEVDLEEIKSQAKKKLYIKEKKTWRRRFQAASTLVKVATIAGVLAIGTTSAIAANKLFFYVPNEGVSTGKERYVLETPVTAYSEKGFYLRITSLSYDGETLKLHAESNWQDILMVEDEIKADVDGEFRAKRGIQLMKGEERLGIHRHAGASGGSLTEEDKLEKVTSLEDLTLVLNAVTYDEKKKEYQYYDQLIKIPLKELQLCKAKEVKSVQELGTESKSEGIGVVGISSWQDGVRSIDFQAGFLPQTVEFQGIRECSVTTEEGKKKALMNDPTHQEIRKYLLFLAGQEEHGMVEISKISINKKVQEKELVFTLPKVGEKVTVNQVVDCDGEKVRIKSLEVSNREDDGDGEGYYGITAEVAIDEINEEGCSIQPSTFVNASVQVGKEISGGYGYSGGTTFIGCSIPEKDFDPNKKIKITINGINQLDKTGNWKIPF